MKNKRILVAVVASVLLIVALVCVANADWKPGEYTPASGSDLRVATDSDLVDERGEWSPASSSDLQASSSDLVGVEQGQTVKSWAVSKDPVGYEFNTDWVFGNVEPGSNFADNALYNIDKEDEVAVIQIPKGFEGQIVIQVG